VGSYIQASDLLKRYPLASTWGQADELEAEITYAEAAVEGMLAPAFTVPFAEAYTQVKDLCIDEVWRRLALTRHPDAATALEASIASRVKALLAGQAGLIGSAGDVTYGSKPELRVWSNTMGYKPTFDTRPAEDQHYDPTRQDDEEDADDAVV